MSATAIQYNENLDAGEQASAEEAISATIFDRQDYIDEGARFTRTACDRLGYDILTGILARFPTGYEVKAEDFKRFTSEIATTIFKRQPQVIGGRVFGEEDCNQLGRDILLTVLAFFHPEFTD